MPNEPRACRIARKRKLENERKIRCSRCQYHRGENRRAYGHRANHGHKRNKPSRGGKRAEALRAAKARQRDLFLDDAYYGGK